MSDDDDNLVCFNEALKENKSNNAISIEERVINCMTNPTCKCMYCTYKKNATKMMVDFLARDVLQFEKNTGATLCTYDMKDVLFRAINEIKNMEKEDDEG